MLYHIARFVGLPFLAVQGFALFFSQQVSAQQQQPVQERIFTPEDVAEIVRKYHPAARRADIVTEIAKANRLAAAGAFDPVASYGYNNKTFDGTNYYYYRNADLRIPTPIGLDVKTGLDNHGGKYLTSEETRGLTSYLGVEVALLKGVLIDQRRAALRNAKIYRAQSEQERLMLLNDLLYNAYSDYWEWAGAWQSYRIYSRFIENGNKRQRLVRIAFQNGDKATIDTVESYTQLVNYRLLQADAFLKLNNAALQLSNYLWGPGDSAYVIPAHYIPDTLRFVPVFVEQNNLNTEQLAQSSPYVRSYMYKLQMMEVERRLKFQSLLPYLNLKANLLSHDYYGGEAFQGQYVKENYYLGIDFKIPIFLREGRGEYRKATLKVQDTRLELMDKQWQVENKIKYYINQNYLVGQQLMAINTMYNNYAALLRNEELKFGQGESSLFLVNSRENKVLEAMQKRIELQVKYQKAGFGGQWSAGALR